MGAAQCKNRGERPDFFDAALRGVFDRAFRAPGN
jgi:hypothetical protein